MLQLTTWSASTNHLENYEIHEWFHSGQPPNFSFYLLLRITYPHHFVIISLHFKGLLKQLSKHNYNWLAGSPFWVSEVLDKHIYIQGGYQCRWTHGHNTSKLGPIFMVQLLSIDQDSNLCLTKDARCLITWHQHLLGKTWTPRKLVRGCTLQSWRQVCGTLMFLTIILIPAFASPFYVSRLCSTFPLRIIGDTSGSGYPEHHTYNASTSDHRQSASMSWEIPECFANCQGTETLLVFTRCQILLLRRSAIRTHLSSRGFK